jgi:opacity protein-like surface antigen
MKLRLMSVSLLAMATAGVCHGQIGIYGKYDATRFKDNNSGASKWFNGPTFGVYDDFVHLGPVSLGADLRGNFSYSGSYRYRTGLVGLRGAVKVPLVSLKPYVQGSIGVAGTGFTGPYAPGISGGDHFSNKFAYQVMGGVDYTVLPHLDFRLVELGYGQVTGTTGSPGNPRSDVFSIGAGVVLRLR